MISRIKMHMVLIFIALILISPVFYTSCASKKEAPKEEKVATPPPVENRTKTKKPAEQPKKEPRMHIVQEGETLSIIAKMYKVSVDAIVKLNNIADANFIKIGQQILIPEPEESLKEE